MFSRCSLDVLRIFPGCFQDAPMGLVGLVVFVDHLKWKYGLQWSKGTRWSPAIQWSQLFDDPQLFNDQLEVWTLIIQKCTVIPPSLMVLFFFLPMFNLFVIVDCVTPSLASQVLQKTCWFFRAQVFSGKFYLFESPIILAPRTFYCLKPVKSK